MKMSIAFSCLAALALCTPVRGADFINLNFEQAQAPALQGPGLAFLDWGVGAPGWSHSSGADTGSIFYGTVHVGNTQWFALTSAQSLPSLLLSGRYSFAFNSGYAAPSGPGSPFVQATLSQTGTIPTDARSLRLRALGPLAVFLGDTPIALHALGGDLYAGDIEAYSGQTFELRLVNLSSGLSSPVAVDDIVFSPLAAVPELPALPAFAAGLACLLAIRRQRRPASRPR